MLRESVLAYDLLILDFSKYQHLNARGDRLLSSDAGGVQTPERLVC
jgi:hypothetical protein